MKIPHAGKKYKAKKLAALQSRLEDCLDKPSNKTCADCPEPNPKWACLLLTPSFPSMKLKKTMGVFCCHKCCNYHMQMGKEVCEVKNTKDIESWSSSEVTALEYSGNEQVNSKYEARMDQSVKTNLDKLKGMEEQQARSKFVQQKYMEKIYFDNNPLLTHAAKQQLQAGLLQAGGGDRKETLANAAANAASGDDDDQSVGSTASSASAYGAAIKTSFMDRYMSLTSSSPAAAAAAAASTPSSDQQQQQQEDDEELSRDDLGYGNQSKSDLGQSFNHNDNDESELSESDNSNCSQYVVNVTQQLARRSLHGGGHHNNNHDSFNRGDGGSDHNRSRRRDRSLSVGRRGSLTGGGRQQRGSSRSVERGRRGSLRGGGGALTQQQRGSSRSIERRQKRGSSRSVERRQQRGSSRSVERRGGGSRTTSTTSALGDLQHGGGSERQLRTGGLLHRRESERRLRRGSERGSGGDGLNSASEHTKRTPGWEAGHHSMRTERRGSVGGGGGGGGARGRRQRDRSSSVGRRRQRSSSRGGGQQQRGGEEDHLQGALEHLKGALGGGADEDDDGDDDLLPTAPADPAAAAALTLTSSPAPRKGRNSVQVGGSSKKLHSSFSAKGEETDPAGTAAAALTLTSSPAPRSKGRNSVQVGSSKKLNSTFSSKGEERQKQRRQTVAGNTTTTTTTNHNQHSVVEDQQEERTRRHSKSKDPSGDREEQKGKHQQQQEEEAQEEEQVVSIIEDHEGYQNTMNALRVQREKIEMGNQKLKDELALLKKKKQQKRRAKSIREVSTTSTTMLTKSPNRRSSDGAKPTPTRGSVRRSKSTDGGISPSSKDCYSWQKHANNNSSSGSLGRRSSTKKGVRRHKSMDDVQKRISSLDNSAGSTGSNGSGSRGSRRAGKRNNNNSSSSGSFGQVEDSTITPKAQEEDDNSIMALEMAEREHMIALKIAERKKAAEERKKKRLLEEGKNKGSKLAQKSQEVLSNLEAIKNRADTMKKLGNTQTLRYNEVGTRERRELQVAS